MEDVPPGSNGPGGPWTIREDSPLNTTGVCVHHNGVNRRTFEASVRRLRDFANALFEALACVLRLEGVAEEHPVVHADPGGERRARKPRWRILNPWWWSRGSRTPPASFGCMDWETADMDGRLSVRRCRCHGCDTSFRRRPIGPSRSIKGCPCRAGSTSLT